MKLSKPVLIEGIYYNSINIAANILNVDNRTIVNRINSKNFTEYCFTDYRLPLEKMCSKCKEIKLLSEFKKTKANRHGRNSWCKKCHSTYTATHTKRELANKNNHKYLSTEKGKSIRMLAKVKRRAYRYNASVNLSETERKYVLYLYGKMRIMRKYGFDVHVDHIVPLSKGGLHIPENLEIIPAEDNLRKNNRLSVTLR